MELRRKKTSNMITKPSPKYKDPSWKPREKKNLLKALESVVRGKSQLPDADHSPYDIVELQRLVPNRSQEEIKEFIDGCVCLHHDLLQDKTKKFSKTNIKKWINSCAASSHDQLCCSETGYGDLTRPTPALTALSVFKYDGTEMEDSGDYNSSLKSAKLFIEEAVHGLDPSCEEHLTDLEAYILVQAMNDLENKVSRADAIQQERYFYGKYQESKKLPHNNNSDVEESPATVYDSKFLNPLGLSKRDTSCVHFSKFKVVDT